MQKDDAEMVLLHLSRRYNCEYSLKSVRVVLEEPSKGVSDILALMAKIDADYEAAQSALHDFAEGATRHEVITRKMEYMAQHLFKLGEQYGDDTVSAALVIWSDQLAAHPQFQPRPLE